MGSQNHSPSRKIIVQTAVAAKTVIVKGIRYHNVLKKLLPDASGSYPVTQWNPDSAVVLRFPYSYSVSKDTGWLYAVAFVQDATTKEILQAGTTDTSSIATAVNEVFTTGDENAFTIYPNPANGKAYFMLLNERKQVTYITIYDMLGAAKKIVSIQPFEQSIEVDLTGLSTGLYIAKPNTTDIPAQRLVITK